MGLAQQLEGDETAQETEAVDIETPDGRKQKEHEDDGTSSSHIEVGGEVSSSTSSRCSRLCLQAVVVEAVAVAADCADRLD